VILLSEILLQAVNISKEFSGVRVLNQINAEIGRGEIFGIIGENGAGKSTFIKIISGTYFPTEGQLIFEGNPVSIRDSGTAKSLGISVIPQEFNLINDLNVYENIFLGKEFRQGYLLNRKLMNQKAAELLKELRTEIAPEEKIENLSVAQKQMVEIAKALADDARLLIMDEPTTVLTYYETEILFTLMRRLQEKGVTLIYISHKLKEVKQICDRVMVLRDGDLISINPTSALDEREMARQMVGRELNQIFPEKAVPAAEVVLRVENLSVPKILSNINFDLRKGEILGFAGLMGAGRTELAETMIGIRKKLTGRIVINGREAAIKTIQDAVGQKMAYLPEDRQGTGVLRNFDLTSNLTLTSLPKYGRVLIDHRAEQERARYYVENFNIKAASLKTKLEFLSGGNQQKVALGKCLDTGPEIFIIDEPTRGIDVNAKKEIYHFIHQLVESGISCILISSEMEEIIGLCNRVVVMREGKITGILDQDHLTEEEIMYYATGLKGGAA
jgi:ribose transport system ATP-binding protein